MIRYECYDEYGNKDNVVEVEAETLETVIIKSGNNFYRPICYDLNVTPHTAKCIPVAVIEANGRVGNDNVPVSEDEERHDLRF